MSASAESNWKHLIVREGFRRRTAGGWFERVKSARLILRSALKRLDVIGREQW